MLRPAVRFADQAFNFLFWLCVTEFIVNMMQSLRLIVHRTRQHLFLTGIDNRAPGEFPERDVLYA